MRNRFLDLLRRNFRFGRMLRSRTVLMAGSFSVPGFSRS